MANFTNNFLLKNNTICNEEEQCYQNLTTMHMDQMVFSKATIDIFKIIYVSVFIVGMFGNIITSTSMVVTRHLRRAVHVYTFNLAICDMLILCFYVPTQILFINDQLDWRMGIEMCKIVNVILPITLTCTIGCLLAITLDRKRGLAQPLKWRADSVKTAKVILLIIWSISMIVNIPLFIFPKLVRYESITICTDGWPKLFYGEIYWVCIFAFTYCIPLIIMVVAYISIVISVGKVSIVTNKMHEKHHKKMFAMGAKLVAVFAICTGFQHFFFFLTSSFSTVHLPTKTLVVLYGVSNWFVSLQAAINPYIYGNMRNLFPRLYIINNAFLNTISKHFNNVRRRLRKLSLLAYDEKSGVNSNNIMKGKFPTETRMFLNPAQFNECIHPLPCVYEDEEYSVVKLIYEGLYIKRDSYSELESTHV